MADTTTSKPEWIEIAEAGDTTLAEAARTVEYLREELVDDARRLAERMTRVADRLEADPSHSPNSLGEVQGLGLNVDRLCGELSQARKARALIEHDRERRSREED